MPWFDVLRDTEAIALWQREAAADAARETPSRPARRRPRTGTEHFGHWIALPLLGTAALVGALVPGSAIPRSDAAPAPKMLAAISQDRGSSGLHLRFADHERWAGSDPDPSVILISRVDPVSTTPAVPAPPPAPVDPVAAAQEADRLIGIHGPPGAIGSNGIPVTVLAAYRAAETTIGVASPACHLPWWLLAGIGRIESGHAAGGRVDAAGTTVGSILGVRLDGSLPGTSVIRDSDGGALDGDPLFDRAVGPMQFLPGTWQRWGRDGNGDGRIDPNNVFDAATSAGAYLCAGGRDLATGAGIAAAVLSYNNSQPYLEAVLAWGTTYRDSVTPVVDGTGPVPPPATTTTAPTTTPPTTTPPTTTPPTTTPPTTTTSPPTGTTTTVPTTTTTATTTTTTTTATTATTTATTVTTTTATTTSGTTTTATP